MLLLAIILKALVEVAFLIMLGQGILFIFAGAMRDRNLVYRLFAAATQPIMKAARFITPRFVVDQHVWLVAVFLLIVLWVLALALKVHFFVEQGGVRPP